MSDPLDDDDDDFDRVPPCSDAERRRVDRFLAHFEKRIDLTCRRYRELLSHTRSTGTYEMYRHYRERLSAITWLRAMNAQRRASANDPATR